MRGVDEGFIDFVDRHYEQLVAYATVLTGDRGEAGDVVHDALLKLVHHIGRRDIANEAAYARTTLFRVFVSHCRSRRRRGEVPLPEEGDHVPVAVDAVAVAGQRREMLALLVRLPPRMRAVLAARLYLDLDVVETARLLGCSTGTVKSTTARGLMKLRQLWDTPS